MNEKQGYPSSLDEAEKVKELEGKVANIEQGIGQILSHLHGTNAQPTAPNTFPPCPYPDYSEDQSYQANQVSNVPTGGSPASRVEPPTPTPVPSATVPPPNPPSTDSSELSEPESKRPKLRQVILKDGRKISVPAVSSPATPMSLGPATDQTQPPQQMEAEDLNDDWDSPIAVVPEPEQEVAEPIPDPKIAQTQQLVQDVNTFIRTKDVHRFWRQYLSTHLHRHVGYNGWPKALQVEFDTRFKGFLQDPQFVSSVCRKVVSMELGHALSVKPVVSFLVVTAGFTSLALCGLDG